jgi:uncharacterized SAM-binding protein YcdF (DUF218 family)
MFALKKLVTPFLLPPGIIVIMLVLLGIWCWRRRQRGTAFIAVLLGAALWAVSANPVSQLLNRGLEKGLGIPDSLNGDVIILLGAGINDGVPDLSGRGTPTSEMLGRLVTAVRVHRRLKVPIIVSGGAAVAGQTAEAPVVRRFLLDLGVPEKQVLLESKSRDTIENARYCSDILKSRGFRHPLLITSAYHMPRSIKAFKLAGVAVTPVPAQFSTGGSGGNWVHYLPSSSALHSSSRALHEYLGMLWYRLKG